MRNEINLFDMLLAKKLGGGSEPDLGELVVRKNGTYNIEDYSQIYAGWKKVTANLLWQRVDTIASNLSQFNLASGSFSGEYPATSYLTFTLGSLTELVPVFIQQISSTNGYNMTGGIVSGTGDGFVFLARGSYDAAGLVLDKAIKLQSGVATDITQYAQAGITDVALSRYRIPTEESND